MTRVVCIIPARMGSSRFPGKPLAPLLGMPLVIHVWHRCRLHDGFERVVVATCDDEIREVVESHGGEAVMTADTHERATDRTEEAVANLGLSLADDDLVVMVQGDEVLVTPAMITAVVTAYRDSKANVVNLVSRLYRQEDHDDPNTVKVVVSLAGEALYFSRAPIPSRARVASAPMFQQTGVMAFATAFLRQFSALPRTPLEKAESVDMLRVIEHGLPLRVATTESETIGVDTQEDLSRAEAVLETDPVAARYLSATARA